MSPDRKNTKPLWLVRPCLDASEYRDKLIGSVVKYPDMPTERRIPYKMLKLPREIVPELDPKPVQVRNVKFWQRRIKDAEVSASLHEILEGFVERAKEDNKEKAATVARMWHMDSPGEKFRELLKNKQYFEELFNLLRESPDSVAYFITDVVTLVNLETTDEHARSKGAGVGVKVPVDAAVTGTGAVSLVTVGASGKYQVSRETGYSATYEEEIIVFIGYRQVRLEKVVGARAKFGRAFLGEKHGFTVRDGLDYWPQMVERPVEGDTEQLFMGQKTPRHELKRELGADDGGGDDESHTENEDEESTKEHEEIVTALGFDVEVVG